jgi:hypothetical protein
MSTFSGWLRAFAASMLYAVAFAAAAQSSSPTAAVTPPGGGVLPAATQPSWALNAGVPNSCSGTSGGALFTTVNINNPAAASEQGVLFANGPGVIGSTFDTSYTGVNPSVGFTIFLSATYNLPAHTPIRLTITTFNLPNYLGGVSYVDTNWWDCTTGLFVPGPTANVPTLSEWALIVMSLAVLAIGIVVVRRRVRVA